MAEPMARFPIPDLGEIGAQTMCVAKGCRDAHIIVDNILYRQRPRDGMMPQGQAVQVSVVYTPGAGL